MTRKDLIHFLIVFDHSTNSLTSTDKFTDSGEAVEAYAAAEVQAEENRDLEIVLVAADSLATIRRTHANYFGGVTDLESRFLEGLATA